MTLPNLQMNARDFMPTRIATVTREYNAQEISILIHTGSFFGMPGFESGNHPFLMVTEFAVLKSLVS